MTKQQASTVEPQFRDDAWGVTKTFLQTFKSVTRVLYSAQHKDHAKDIGTDCCFEAFIFTLISQAVEAALNLRLVPKMHGTDFVLRGGPGTIRSTPKQFSFMEFTHNGCVYEIHVDTNVECRVAGAVMEEDVAIFVHADADKVRKAISPKLSYSSIRLAVEAKYRTEKVKTVVAKEVLGQLSQTGGSHCISIVFSNQDFTPNAKLLLQGMGVEVFSCVVPGSTAQLEGIVSAMRAILVNKIESMFPQVTESS